MNHLWLLHFSETLLICRCLQCFPHLLRRIRFCFSYVFPKFSRRFSTFLDWCLIADLGNIWKATAVDINYSELYSKPLLCFGKHLNKLSIYLISQRLSESHHYLETPFWNSLVASEKSQKLPSTGGVAWGTLKILKK